MGLSHRGIEPRLLRPDQDILRRHWFPRHSMLAEGRESLGDVAYERNQPEQTLLYQLVEAHYPALVNQLAQQGKSPPDRVYREFGAYLKCGRLEHGYRQFSEA